MPTFIYTARNSDGTIQKGHLDAPSEEDVIASLQHRGLLITSIGRGDLPSEKKDIKFKKSKAGRRLHTGVKVEDHVMLCQQLATLVEAGVPLLKSLEVVSTQVESRRLLLALDEVRRDVAGGRTFRESLGKHPAIFSNLWINLVETGEASGHLAESLRQLSHHFELAQKLQTEAQTAMTYPMFLCFAAMAVMAVFVYWLIPKFMGIFQSLGGMELPLLTRIVMGISNIARKYWVLVVMGGSVGFWVVKSWLATSSGQWTRDRFLLTAPGFKDLFTYIQLAEFSRGLTTLLESGVPLLSGLEILEHSATNRVYGEAIGQIREAVKQGKTMAEPMEQTGYFPPMCVQMVAVGEEVGELAKMSAQMAKHYEERTETFIARMTRLFEPIAICVMGVIVLIIVLSIFMPIFNLSSGGSS